MLTNILICTAIMWIIQSILVSPISAYITEKRLMKINLPVFSSGEVIYDDLPAEEKEKVDEVSTTTYIATDVIILGLAGFLAGFLLGFWFIGISWDKTGWPGMAAFIALSILGSNL